MKIPSDQNMAQFVGKPSFSQNFLEMDSLFHTVLMDDKSLNVDMFVNSNGHNF